MILNADNVLDFIPKGLQLYGKKAQVGIDLAVTDITKIVGGAIFQGGKKDIKRYAKVPSFYSPDGVKTWKINKGVYSLSFEQDIKLDNKHCAFIIGRSTTNRLGLLIRSAVFDPGFECSSIGATMYVFEDCEVEIQELSCLAQLVIFECQESEVYNGDFQGEKDLK
ncbi:hypothetical protein SJC03_243 [Bacteroides phage SJC03]|nr:hypothetical protein SJC03_243 [Bacteroides phage SJC03]